VTRVLAVAQSALLRAGLASIADVVASASTLDQALMLAAELNPDLMVVESDDQSVQDVIAAAAESPPILLLSAEPDPAWAAKAMRAGIRGIIPRDAPESEIAAAIEAVAAGLIVLHPQSLDGAFSNRVNASALQTEPLTPREIEVLRLMAEGESNKTIAWKLNISGHTVKFHVNSILTKMSAGSRTEAVMLGIRSGLIPL
jgi:DNA-binding NarL/FixJ family response regulator